MHKFPKEQIAILLDLQKIEVEGSRIRILLKGIDGRVKALDKQLKEAERNLSAELIELEEFKKSYRSLEIDVQDNVSLMERNREKMRSVKTNKEYQALMKGIDEIRERNSEIEEKMIEQLEMIEQKESKIAQMKSDIQTLQEKIETEKTAIFKEEEQQKAILADFDGRFNHVAESVNTSLMSLYKRIQSGTKGIAVTPVRDAVCTGCNVNIPPQLFNELLQNEGVDICPHCQRMIYWEKPASD